MTIRTEWGSFLEGWTLGGQKGDLEVTLHTVGGRPPTMDISVKPLDATAGLRLRVEQPGPATFKRMGTPEVELGDAAFDSRFLIEGPTARAFAVLDAHTRRAVHAAMSGGGVATEATFRGSALLGPAELESGTLTVRVRGEVDSAEDLAPALRTVLYAAESLAEPREVPESLARNAVQDPFAEVRLGNLKTLVREFPRYAGAVPTLRRCCEDSEDEVRLHAATALGQEGRETLLSLAFGGPWPQLPAAHEPLAANAVAALGTALPADRALQALGEMLERGRLQTACACIDSLALEGRGAAVAGCEAALLEALSHADGGVRACTARALGNVGSAAAVLALREAGERFAGDLRAAARQAVAQIQSRLSGASPGQVSITGTGTGQVSLTGTGGEVSVSSDH